MLRCRSLRYVVLCGIVTLLTQAASGQSPSDPQSVKATQVNKTRTALDDYVAQPDPAFSWKVVAKQNVHGITAYVIDLKSQRWLTEKEVDRPLWQHWLTVMVPTGCTAKTALMYIGGGANGKPPGGPDGRTFQLAAATKTVVASLGMIPNQPLTFHQDGIPRTEDDLIGYTWDQYLKTGDERWPARLPMTKAVVRAMDVVQALSSQEDFQGPAVQDFVVAGGSKRGWTTWTVGVVDKRVKAIAPIVIDVLNANVSMHHHYCAYGFWAPAIGDYVAHKITHRRFEPRYEELLQLVDPFAYRDRLDMPKCVINATGDQFFVPDSSQFYFGELTGEKHLCYVPNSEHSLKGTNALDTLAAFHYAIVHDIPRPQCTWEFPSADTIRVVPQTRPQRVLLWQAHNSATRDFRVDTIGRAYQSTELSRADDGSYLARVKEPEQGWRAFFVQLEFDVAAPTPLRLTTDVRVVPDTLPYADKVAPVWDSGSE